MEASQVSGTPVGMKRFQHYFTLDKATLILLGILSSHMATGEGQVSTLSVGYAHTQHECSSFPRVRHVCSEL